MSSFAQSELVKILEAELITSLYQPIVNLKDGTILGYEALSRGPKNSLLHMPEKLFPAGNCYEQAEQLDCLCRKQAIKKACCLKKQQLLFLNADPAILANEAQYLDELSAFLQESALSKEQIVLEITEKRKIDNYFQFDHLLQFYKKAGISIAIDDVGSGYSGLTLLTKISPHFLKIDFEIIHQLHKDPVKQAIVKSLVMLGTAKGLKIIAEGIEEKAELDMLTELGVAYGQGYYLGYPAEIPLAISPQLEAVIKKKPEFPLPAAYSFIPLLDELQNES